MGILDQLRWVAGRAIAVSSVVDHTLKPVSGGSQVYKGVKDEALKAGTLQSSYKKKSHGSRGLAIMVEEMQAKVETVEEERNSANQLQSSTNCVKASDNLGELLAEPSDESTPQKANRKKVFIRSRL
ncbi:hypothetical protein ACET3Z_016466 [Daucus carota]